MTEYTKIDGEIWHDIPNYSKYKVSNFGRILNKETMKIKSLRLYSYEDYLFTYLMGDDKILHKVYVHRLIAIAFCLNSDPQTKNIVHHIDYNKTNNRVDNLMWVTDKEHRIIHSRKGKELEK